jgi:hypothetical protein
LEGNDIAEIPTPTAGYAAPSGDRPMGVTIIAILQFIGGFFGLAIAALAIMAAALVPIFGFLFLILGVFALLVALFGIIVGWGLWTLKSWAWMVALILNIINILLALFPFQPLSLIIPLIIVIYLQQGEVKSTFR